MSQEDKLEDPWVDGLPPLSGEARLRMLALGALELWQADRPKPISFEMVDWVMFTSVWIKHHPDATPRLEKQRAREIEELIARTSNFLVSGGDYKLAGQGFMSCLLYTSPSPRDATLSRMPSSA